MLQIGNRDLLSFQPEKKATMNPKKTIRSSTGLGAGLGVVMALAACTPFTRIQGDAETLSKLNGD